MWRTIGCLARVGVVAPSVTASGRPSLAGTRGAEIFADCRRALGHRDVAARLPADPASHHAESDPRTGRTRRFRRLHPVDEAGPASATIRPYPLASPSRSAGRARRAL